MTKFSFDRLVGVLAVFTIVIISFYFIWSINENNKSPYVHCLDACSINNLRPQDTVICLRDCQKFAAKQKCPVLNNSAQVISPTAVPAMSRILTDSESCDKNGYIVLNVTPTMDERYILDVLACGDINVFPSKPEAFP